VARYDKFDSKLSGPRSFLAADWLPGDLEKVVGVGYDNQGRLVKGAGATGIVGVLVLTRIIKAGREPVDPMKRGEIVQFDKVGRPNVNFTAAAPGTKFYAAADGTVSTTNTGTYIGHTVEKSRLIVNVKEA
jgi:hypothetical protein